MKKIRGSILLTGGSGFVGQAILSALINNKNNVVAVGRKAPPHKFEKEIGSLLSWIRIDEINGETEWKNALKDTVSVVHCAARTHVMHENVIDSLEAYRRVNVAGTLQLARQAADAGVRRFVFLSSIKVNGETTMSGHQFTEDTRVAPQDAYGQSKAEAEEGLFIISRETSMEVVIIRPPLVIGPDAKGNLAVIFKLVQLGIPLPLGAVNNLRSFISLENLVSLVLLCADSHLSPRAANQVFVVADGEDISTTMLLRKVALAVGCPSRLLPVPSSLLSVGAMLLGKRPVAVRLLGNLQVDATKVRTLLGWRPIVTLDNQLKLAFRNHKTGI